MTNAIGMGLGFTLGLTMIGCVREILGAGKLFGVALFGDHFQPWVVMVLPPGGFFVLGFWLIVIATFKHIINKRNGQLQGAKS
jgi:electron transport complex protein RnfE